MIDKKLIKKNMNFKNYKINKFQIGMNSKIDDSLSDMGLASKCYNYSFKNGVLTDCIGIGDIRLMYENYIFPEYKTIYPPSDIFVSACYFFRYWNYSINLYENVLIAYCPNNKLYYNFLSQQDPNWYEINNINLTEKPIALYCKVNGNDCLLFYNNNDGMYLWNIYDNVVKIQNYPKITSMCIHNDRLFATIEGEGKSIIFSDELNITNFNISDDEAGYISMNDEFGKCNKVISFNGYLYVFRDYNIARITQGKDKNDYIVDQLHVSNGKIYSKSVAICGDKIVFLATDGLYEFNGKNVTKIDFDFDNCFEKFENTFAHAEYFDGNYYLASKFNFDNEKYACETVGGYLNNSLIKIDVANKNFEIVRGIDVKQFVPIEDGINNCMVLTYSFKEGQSTIGLLDNSGAIKGDHLKKYWISKFCDFGDSTKSKFIKSISVLTKNDVTLELYVDDKVLTRNIKGKDSIQSIRINEKGKRIRFGLLSEKNNVSISNLVFTIGKYE